MPRPIAAITQPVQLHAEGAQVTDRRCVLRMTAQQPDSSETKAQACRRECMKVIGMRATEADDARSPGSTGLTQVLQQFEPLVAADQRVDEVKAQHRRFNTGTAQPGQ